MFKWLLRGQSPRDYIDLLLSLKHAPNVTLCDFPHMVASHVNKRKANFLRPFEGRVHPPTDQNIELFENGRLEPISLPFLESCNPAIIPIFELDPSVHPQSLLASRYCLYDMFHDGNTKQKKEKLRSPLLVKELVRTNTETSEQTNEMISKHLSIG